MEPKTSVVSQEQIDKESDLAWEQFREEQRKDEGEDICPCGHNDDQHYAGEYNCEVSSCDCPQFGEPIENWQTFKEINLGDNLMGFKIYE